MRPTASGLLLCLSCLFCLLASCSPTHEGGPPLAARGSAVSEPGPAGAGTVRPTPGPPAPAVASAQPSVVVDGRVMAVNGEREVPRGLFGVHATKVTPESVADLGIECFRQIHFLPGSKCVAIGKDGKLRDTLRDLAVVIDCQGDRYCPATVLSNADYTTFYRKLGREYGERCRAAGWPGVVEFWNEPYLNWASRSHGSSRNHYHSKWYEVEKAREGGKVTIKGWKEPLEHLRWKRTWARGEDGKIGWGVKVPDGLAPGDTFRSRNRWYWTKRHEQTFTVVDEWHVHDPTQVKWWSGRQNLDFYLWMFLPFAEEVKRADAGVKVIAGWDFGLSHGDWAVWRELCVPVIDRGIEWMDGLTEHHYGVDTRAVTAWYEVATAYTVSCHGKWIRVYNTECGGRLDPAVHGMEALERDALAPLTDDEREAIRKDAAEASYTLRDIIELAHRSPAKVGSRTAHAVGEDSGTAWALRLLKGLRGKLVRAESGDPDLWPVACVNGDSLVVVAFNNAKEEREAAFRLAAPRGTTFREAHLAWIGVDPEAKKLRIFEGPLETGYGAGRREIAFRRRLGRRQALKVVLKLAGRPPEATDAPEVERRQFFAKEGVLLAVAPRKRVALSIEVDPALVARADRARLRLVLERVAPGEAALTLNGGRIDVPARSWTTDVALDVSTVKPANELVFTCGGEGADGYRVDAASIVLDAPVR